MATAARIPDVRLELEGMTCASCAARIERKLNKLEGVELASTTRPSRPWSFRSAPGRARELIAAVEAAGYGAVLPPCRWADASLSGRVDGGMLRRW